ncbi:YgcG family protein, partial [Methylibium sp. T29-B]
MRHGWRRWLASLALALLVGPWSASSAQDLRPVPVLSASVIDQTGTLTRAQVSALEAKLAAFEREAGSQLVVLIVATTQPEDIAAYAQRVGESWKIGRREVGDGLIVLVAKDDRKVRIEVAKALEGAVPDLAARQIIDRALTPAFRAGDFAGGLNAAVDQLAARIRGEALPAPGSVSKAPQSGAQWQDFAMFFLLAVPIAGAVLTGVLGRKLGTLATSVGAGGLAWAVSASLLIGGAAALVALVLVGVLGL